MLPFCGYHMGDYFAHWISMAKKTDRKNLPKIYSVNWFRKSPEGKWMWPGYGENSRVLKWIVERIEGKASANETAIGFVPTAESLDVAGLKIDKNTLNDLLAVNKDNWKKEADSIEQHFKQFGDKLPSELTKELNDLRSRLN